MSESKRQSGAESAAVASKNPSRRKMFQVAGAGLVPAIVTLRARTAHAAADYTQYVYGDLAQQRTGGGKVAQGSLLGGERDDVVAS